MYEQKYVESCDCLTMYGGNECIYHSNDFDLKYIDVERYSQ